MKTKISMVILSIILLALVIPTISAQQSDNPTLSATLATYDPVPASPGRSVDVWINIQNLGNKDASKVKIEFIDSSSFTLLSEADRVTEISSLGARSDYLIKYTVKVSENAIDGTNYLILKYGDEDFSYEKKIAIDVKSTEVPITISSVKMNPKTLVPGSKSEITISIKNLAKSVNIKDLTVSMGLSPVAVSTTVIDLPFVPMESASQKTIDRITAGQTAEVSFVLAAYPNAEAGIYKVPVTLEFSDDSGTSYSEIVLIGIEVNSQPDILATIEGRTINSKVKDGEVTFDITNKGLNNIKLMTVTLKESDGYEIMSPSNTLYIRNIDSDDFESVNFNIKATGTDNLKFPLTIEFKDAFNNKYSEDIELEYIIRDAPNENRSFGAIIVVVLIIIIVVVVVVRKRRKKSKRRTE